MSSQTTLNYSGACLLSHRACETLHDAIVSSTTCETGRGESIRDIVRNGQTMLDKKAGTKEFVGKTTTEVRIDTRCSTFRTNEHHDDRRSLHNPWSCSECRP